MMRYLLMILLASMQLSLTGCETTAGGSRANDSAGPISARARNSIASKGPEAMAKIARSFEQGGDPGNALNMYLQAIAAYPTSVVPKMGAANLYSNAGEFGAARRLLQAALISEPDNDDVKLMLTSVYLMEGDSGLARNLLGSLNRTDANRVRIDTLFGFSYDIEAMFELAQGYYLNALDIQPDAPTTLTNYALSQALSGRYDVAVSAIQVNLNRTATRADARENLALIYAMSGQTKAAVSIIETILTPDEVRENALFYNLLPLLTDLEKARAVFLRKIPAGVLNRANRTQKNDAVAQPEPVSSGVPSVSEGEKREGVKPLPVKTPPAKVVADTNEPVSKQSKTIQQAEDERVEAEKAAQAAKLIEATSTDQSEEKEDSAAPETRADNKVTGDGADIPVNVIPSNEDGKPQTPDHDESADDISAPVKADIETSHENSEPEEVTAMESEEAADLYRIQLVSVGSLLSADKEWCRLHKRIEQSSADLTPVLRPVDQEDGSKRYRLLLSGFDMHSDAQFRCDVLQEDGVNCFIVKGGGVLLPLASKCITASSETPIQEDQVIKD